MDHGQAISTAGWVISGFQVMVAVAVWVAAVLIYGLWRSVGRPEPDAIRPSGPID